MTEPSTDEREDYVEEVHVIVHAAIADAYKAGQKSRPAVDVANAVSVSREVLAMAMARRERGSAWDKMTDEGRAAWLREADKFIDLIAALAGEGR